MIFRSLVIADFGTYAGENRIELAPGPEQPITLIGGTNGAGKTTILEGILLCLHGRKALGRAVALKDYERHIASRIHTPPSGQESPSHASLALALEHTHAGRTNEYVVERTWKLTRTGRVQESLYLTRDNNVVDDLPESSWQDFLDGLVPPGVAGLFLFDGEKIQALAEDNTGEHLAEAVNSLLGLDVVAQLRVDLARYVAKADGNTEHALTSSYAASESALRERQERVRDLQDTRSHLEMEREKAAQASEAVRERFAQQGGALAEERAELERKERRATERSLAAAAEIRELVAGLLPFAICPEIAASLEGRLQREEFDEENEVIRKRLRTVQAKLSRAVTAKSDSKSTARTISDILLGEETDASPRIHELSATERALVSDQLNRAQRELPRLATAAAKRLARSDEERARARDVLDKVPDSSATSGLLSELQELERDVGRVEAEIAQIDDELHRAQYEVTRAERDFKRAGDALRTSEDVAHRSGLALRASAALERFQQRVQESKLDRVQLETARYFNRLSRKGEMLSAVMISPDSFQMTLKRWDGAELPKERLSAGEKQLLAIAVLWALAHVSGRPLPVVIDTPLARLDNKHRARLLGEYFPTVSHQVIVLSTDTEVDRVAADSLKSATARRYHLRHDTEACRTLVEDGYFATASEAADAG